MTEDEKFVELKRCKESVRYFYENYWKIANGDEGLVGVRLVDADIERFFDLYEKAEKEGGKLLRVWMRGKYKWVIVKELE